MTTYLRVLYTKQLLKKKKTYHDGFLKVQESGSAVLLDESGRELASSYISAKQLPLQADTEGISCLDGFLVNCDEFCTAADLPSGGGLHGVEQVQQKINPAAAAAAGKSLEIPVLGGTKGTARFKRPAPAAVTLRPAPAHSQSSADALAHAQKTEPHQPYRQLGNSADVDAKKALPPLRSDEDILRLFYCSGSLEGPSCIRVSDAPVASETGIPRRHQVEPFLQGEGLDRTAELHHGDLHCSERPMGSQPLSRHPGSAPQHAAALTDLEACCDSGMPESSRSPAGLHDCPGSLVPNVPDTAQAGCSANRETDAAISTTQQGTTITMSPTACWQHIPVEQPSAKRARFKAPAMAATAWKPAVRINSVPQGSNRDSKTESLIFPGPGFQPSRKCAIPNTFANEADYVNVSTSAIEEELNLRTYELAKRFHSTLQQCTNKKQVSAADITAAMRKARVLYYGNCELACYAGRAEQEMPESFFLTLKADREPSKDYRLDDIWILSNSPTFASPLRKSCIGDRLNQPWTALARSRWHGPSKDGKMQITFLSRPPPCLKRPQAVYALHGQDAMTELAMLDALKGLTTAGLPVLPYLLKPAATAPTAAGIMMNELQVEARQTAKQFNLNNEQTVALQATVPWFSSADQAGTMLPICIVHGPFGSGKSTLLVAMLHFFAQQMAKPGTEKSRSSRVLVAAHTNAAVDRVLTGLLDNGFTDLVRVGSLRRIDKRLLPHSLHARQDKAGSDAASELADMLKTCTSVAEAAILQKELAEVKAGVERKRKKLLRSAAVVGVTCCSATLPLLDDLSFGILVLDECSQIVEPLSLLTLERAKCRFLVAAGDPCQLPPLVTSPCEVEQKPGEPRRFGLARPLFARLVAMGYPSHLLCYQYRCHPTLSLVPNAMFYQGQLRDGCSSEQRSQLILGVPALVCLHAPGNCHADTHSQSCSNRGEAAAIVTVIRRLMTAGVPAAAIGVICFFRAQVILVKTLLAALMTGQDDATSHPASSLADITVATVDSFQGMEKEVIILSVTVSRPGPFCSDVHRLNVALTRARRHLIIAADLSSLSCLSPAFSMLMKRAEALPGGICHHLATFIPQPLYNAE